VSETLRAALRKVLAGWTEEALRLRGQPCASDMERGRAYATFRHIHELQTVLARPVPADVSAPRSADAAPEGYVLTGGSPYCEAAVSAAMSASSGDAT
jgi:hypothetical protein